jgi:ribosome-associated toxin RatA of RatAB toxin-antitoxin module
MIKAVINVEASRPQVFTILSDYARYPDWLPGCESSTVIAVNGANSDADIVINSMKKMTLGVRIEAVPAQVLNFKMYSGKDGLLRFLPVYGFRQRAWYGCDR